MKQYVCSVCGYIHDEAVGGKWEDLPADWKCHVCKHPQAFFEVRAVKQNSAGRAGENAIQCLYVKQSVNKFL